MICKGENILTIQRWRSPHQALGIESVAHVLLQLQRAYSSPLRHYHTAPHIADCLEQLEQYRHLAEHPAEVAIALWFHDAVYHPQRRDNEAKSAAWAQRYLYQAGLASSSRDRVVQLILATRHPGILNTPDEQLMVDLDLSILGQSPAQFEHYCRAIRAEYAWVPEVTYCAKRRSLLRAFLDQETIYQTPALRTQYEAPARQNLQNAIAQLGISTNATD